MGRTIVQTLRDSVRGSLEALTRAGNTAQKLARRARILLLAAEGLGDSEISRRVQANRKTVVEWRRRAPQIAEGSARELADRRRPGEKRVLTPELVERIIHTTLRQKPEGCTHWSTPPWPGIWGFPRWRRGASGRRTT